MVLSNIYLSELEKIKDSSEPHYKLNYSLSILRSLLQAAAVVAIEISDRLIDEAELPNNYKLLKSRMQEPNDGLAREVIDSLTPVIKGQINPGFYNCWFESYSGDQSFCDKINEWVEFRNCRYAHGVVDDSLARFWSERTVNLIEDGLNIFSMFVDKPVNQDGLVRLGTDFEGIEIKTPLVIKGKAYTVSKISRNKGIWILKTHVLSATSSKEESFQLGGDNPLVVDKDIGKSRFRLSEVISQGEYFSVYNNIPARQTPVFEGRGIEKEKLITWFAENQQRACLIYGDGGVGKTTLTLEFFNSWLDNEIEIPKPVPEIVCFYSAKMTEWNDSGIRYLKGSPEALDQCLRELMHCIESSLSKKWHTTSGDKLIDKVETELVKNGFSKDDVLLIIDNTETFVNSTSDLACFTSQLKKISIKIGRVLLTSRRREHLAFEPIPVTELSETESISLLDRLAKQYGAKPIIQAGETRLRKISNQLSRKPLLIDALVKHIARSECGIDEALNNLYMKTNDDLLEFLYEDAWERMSLSQRHMFMVLTTISYPINEFTVSRACQLIQIPIEEFHESLDEAYFCSVADYGASYDVHIVNLAMRFFQKKVSELSCVEKKTIQEYSEDIDRQAAEKERVDNEYRIDRVEEAFRTQAAKSAKIESDKGRYEDADVYFQVALTEDPLNASLYDRYAWFLLHKKGILSDALKYSEKSLEINSNSPDALMTRAMIAYREDKIREGDDYVTRSLSLGKPISLGLLRMAIARYHAAKNIDIKKEKESFILEARELIKKADKNLKPGSNFYFKNKRDISRYRNLIERLGTEIRLRK